MSEDFSKNLTTSKMLVVYVCLVILWSSISIYNHGFSLLRALRLIHFFAILPFKLWVMTKLIGLHFLLSRLLFYKIFEPNGVFDPTTRLVLRHWWVLLLIYFLTGSKPLVGLLSFGLFFILNGIALRRSLLKPEVETNRPPAPLPKTLLFSILSVFILGTGLTAYFTKAYALAIRFVLFLLVLALVIVLERNSSKHGPHSKSTKSSASHAKWSMFPFRFQKKMWYDWIWTILTVFFLMLGIIPIAYLCAWIFSIHLMPDVSVFKLNLTKRWIYFVMTYHNKSFSNAQSQYIL